MSTDDPAKRNMSEKSEILDPFNTSRSGGDPSIDEEYCQNQNEIAYYPSKEIGEVIKFSLRIRELNKAYQALNNKDHDNGVNNNLQEENND